MSSQELQPFFPSATHPAIPVAAQILSTLRALTAPGKGNNLRPEEQAALVGVSALLGCERVQSHDVLEAAAQRLSSVARPHFKSALATARRVLAAAEANASVSASPRSSRSGAGSSSMSTSATGSPRRADTATMTAPSPSGLLAADRSPFSTPKKKFKFTSGVDLSGLLSPHKHAPSSASPLRQSVTPSKRKRAAEEREAGAGEDEADAGASGGPTKRGRKAVTADEAEEEAENEDEEEEDDAQRTPTRPRISMSLQDKLADARKAKERDGAAAFLAMRPGASPVVAKGSAAEVVADYREQFGYDPLVSLGLGSGAAGKGPGSAARLVHKLRERSDWTFRERVWAPDAGGVEAVLGPVPRAVVVPELIVTDDEDEDEGARPASSPRRGDKRTPQQQKRGTPKSAGGSDKRATPGSRTKTTPTSRGGVSLDSIILAAWA